MPYHPDFEKLGLDYLKRRLETEDLIPSRLVLREDLDVNLSRFTTAGIANLADLERSLRTAKLTGMLSERTGIHSGYLTVLGRALRGYRPAPVRLSDYPGIGKDLADALAGAGIEDGRSLFEAAAGKSGREALATKIGRTGDELLELVRLADLSRLQWVSPLFSRLLHDSGFTSVGAVAASTPEDIYERVDALNRERRLFGGKIGLRDMGQLVFIARLTPDEVEE